MKAVGRAKHLRKEQLFTEDDNTNKVDDKSKHRPKKKPQGPKNRPQSHSKLNVHLIHQCKHGTSSLSHPSSMLTTSNPIHPSVHALRHFTAASSFPSISTETFNPAPSQMTFFYLPGAFFTTANHRSVATSIYNFTPPKDFILYLEHWLVSTILEYCTAAHSVALRNVPYLYELVPLPGKVQKRITHKDR